MKKRAPRRSAEPAFDAEAWAKAQRARGADVVALLRKRDMRLEEIAAKLAISSGQALDLCDKAKSEGFNVHSFGGRYSLTREPGAIAPSELHRWTSDAQGRYRFGAIGDTHLGSKYERLDALNALYDMYAVAGISRVYHCGNWIDGEARFNKFDLLPEAHGMQAQLDYFVENYPKRPGIDTYYVAGDDHEGWYAQREGVDIGRMLEDTARADGRTDLHYLGYMEAFIRLEHAKTKQHARLLVSHPGGGSAYATSYAPQKCIEAFQPGEKPAVALWGHWHKMEFANIRGVWSIQVGCTKDLDPFGRKKRLSYHVGGVIVELLQDPRGAISECTPRFRQFFDREYHNDQWNMARVPTAVRARRQIRATADR